MTAEEDLKSELHDLVPGPLRADLGAETGEYPASAALRTGLYAGVFLNVIMVAALLAANRLPRLEPYALERNAVSSCFFLVLMLVPVCRFLNRPLQMLGSAMIAWTIFATGYELAGMYFQNLFSALHRAPLQIFLEGAIVYCMIAAAAWLASIFLHARREARAPVLRVRPGGLSSRPPVQAISGARDASRRSS